MQKEGTGDHSGAWLHPLQPTVDRAPCYHGVDSKAVAPQTMGGRVELRSSIPGAAAHTAATRDAQGCGHGPDRYRERDHALFAALCAEPERMRLRAVSQVCIPFSSLKATKT